MQYYKRYFAGNISFPKWEYYRVHNEGCYDYWQAQMRKWCEPIDNKWRNKPYTGYIEVSPLEIVVVLGAKALGQLSFNEELEDAE